MKKLVFGAGIIFAVLMFAIPVRAKSSRVVVRKNKGSTIIIINKAGGAPFSVYKLQAPPRLVLRIMGIDFLGSSLMDVYTGEVTQIKIKRFSHGAQLEIGLTGKVSYDVKKQKGDILVRFESIQKIQQKQDVIRLKQEQNQILKNIKRIKQRLETLQRLEGQAKVKARKEIYKLQKVLEAYQSRLRVLKQQQVSLKQRLQVYQQEINKAKETEKNLRARLKTMELKMARMVNDSAQKEKELLRLRQELSAIKNRKHRVENEIVQLESRVNQLKAKVKAGGKGAAKAKQEIQTINTKLRDYKKSLKNIQETIKTYQIQKNRLDTQISKKQIKLMALNQKLDLARHNLVLLVKNLKSETQKLREERDNLLKELKNLEKSRKELRLIKTQKFRLQQKIKVLKDNISRLQSSIKRLEQKEMAMMNRYEKAKSRWNIVKTKLNNARNRLISLKNSEKSLNLSIQELRQKHAKLTKQEEIALKDASKQEKKRILDARRQREEHLRRLAHQKRLLSKQITQAKKDVLWLSKRVKSLKQKVAKWETRLHNVRKGVAELASQRDRLAGEMKEFRDNKRSLNRQLEVLKSKLHKVKKSVAIKRSQLSKLDNQIVQRQQSIKRLEYEENVRAQRLSALKEKSNRLKKNILKYKQEVQALKKEKHQLYKEVAKLKLNNKKLKSVRPGAKVLITGVDFIDSPWSHQVIFSFNKGNVPATITKQGKYLIVKVPGAILRPQFKRRVHTDAYHGPIVEFAAWDKVQNMAPMTILKVKLAGKRKYELRQRLGKLIVLVAKNRKEMARSKVNKHIPTTKVASYTSVASTVASNIPMAPRKRKVKRRGVARRRHYTGRFVDLDFKDADIQNVIRLVAEVWGKNVVIPDEVKGTITIKLTNVRVDRAFDVILKSKGLSWKDEGGNIIRIITLQQLQQERQEKLNRMKAKVTLTPLQTKLIPVNYAEADKLAKTIEKNIKSSRGRVTVDKRTNIIIYVDVPAKIRLAEELVRSLDLPTPQVQIEARIVEAESNFIRELGIQWGGSMFANAANGNPTGLIFPSNVGVAGGAMDQKTMTAGVPTAGAANPDFAVNLPANVGTGAGGAIGIALGSLAGAVNINLRLSAMEEIGQVRSISAPKITTLDNVEAKITQGVEIPYPLSSAQGNTVIMKQAVLSLAVTPHVTNDGRVRLKIKVTKDEPDETHRGADGSLGIAKKSAETELLVKSGDTVVIGGIYKRQSTLVYKKVPWFADIPIVGWFFKNQYKKDSRSELLIFITPRILNRRPVVLAR